MTSGKGMLRVVARDVGKFWNDVFVHTPPPPQRDQTTVEIQVLNPPHTLDEQSSKRPWMPKMEFPRFEGECVRIWLDNCQAYFQLYQISRFF